MRRQIQAISTKQYPDIGSFAWTSGCISDYLTQTDIHTGNLLPSSTLRQNHARERDSEKLSGLWSTESASHVLLQQS